MIRKTGRNDPCPCGSGKKFKRCCGPKEDETHLLALPTPLRRIQRDMERSLSAHVHDLHGPEAMAAAWHDFRNEADMEPPADLSPENENFDNHFEWFAPWFLFHWTPGEIAVEEFGLVPLDYSVAADYLVNKGELLSADEREYLVQALSEPFSLWEVLKTEPGRGVEVRDLLLDRRLFVHDFSASRSLKQWLVFLVKTVTVGEITIFDGFYPNALPPQEGMGFADDVRKDLKEVFGKRWDKKQLRECNSLLLSDWAACCDDYYHRPPPRFQNTDGEDMVFVKALWLFDRTFRDKIRGKLARLDGVYDEGDEKTGVKKHVSMVWTKKGNRRISAWENTNVGHLRLYDDHLELETNSRERSLRLGVCLEKVCGGLLCFDNREEKSVDEMRASHGAEKEEVKEPDIPKEVKEKLMTEFLEKHYASWPETKIPSLGNKTPLDAVKTVRGREKVERLIKAMEYQKATDDRDGMDYDFNKLRKKLGLGEE